VACGSDTPLATNPISDANPGTRTATPSDQTFASLDSGKDPISKSLKAIFVVEPELLQTAAQSEISVQSQTLALCNDCSSTATPAPLAASKAVTKGLGTYQPTDLSLQLRGQIPDTYPVGTVNLSLRFLLNTNTQLVNPGSGVRLTIQQALLQDAERGPQLTTAAADLPLHLDYAPKEITQGQSTSKTLSLSFDPVDSAEIQPRFLRLEVVLTSPIPSAVSPGKLKAGTVALPNKNSLYHGVVLTQDETVTAQELQSYVEASGKPAAWAAFTQTWDKDAPFPSETATQLSQLGSLPYIQLLLPSSRLAEMLAGQTDAAWQAWGTAAKTFAAPVIVEFGQIRAEPESAVDPDQLRQVYRQIVQAVRQQGATNVVWVYRAVPRDNGPLGRDYPGDGVVDWIGLQVEYRQTSGSDPEFRSQMDSLYQLATGLSATKPILVASFAVPKANGKSSPDRLKAALSDLTSQQWPRLIGFAWDNSTTALQDHPDLAGVFKQVIGASDQVLGQAVITPIPSAAPGTPTPVETGSPQPTVSPAPSNSPTPLPSKTPAA
jgi:hypothetical protein